MSQKEGYEIPNETLLREKTKNYSPSTNTTTLLSQDEIYSILRSMSDDKKEKFIERRFHFTLRVGIRTIHAFVYIQECFLIECQS